MQLLTVAHLLPAQFVLQLKGTLIGTLVLVLTRSFLDDGAFFVLCAVTSLSGGAELLAFKAHTPTF